jgi:molybdopterin/thiamine biosynthesis adenylyltransferase
VYRMRNATILVLTIRGLATEVVKNIVLAGVGKLIIADNEDVKEEDLGTGFFFREEDVGRKVRFLSPSGFPPASVSPSSDHRIAYACLSEGRCGQAEGRES